MRFWVAACAGLVLAGPAVAQDNPRDKDLGDRAEAVVSQPLKDLGAIRKNPPKILVKAAENPYSLAGLRGCRDYSAEVRRLSEVLGPDFGHHSAEGGPQAGQVAQAGASAIVNSLIPFRGVVREATGAAAADRRLQHMMAAGYARRGFLTGYGKARGCKG